MPADTPNQGKRNKGGRPTKKPAEKLSVPVMMHLTPAEADRLWALVRRKRTSANAALRRVLLRLFRDESSSTL